MIKHSTLWVLLALVFLILTGCNPKVQNIINVSYPALEYNQNVVVLAKGTDLPEGAEKLGFGKIGDTGFSTNCSYQTVVQYAIFEARKAGGNAILITEHREPSALSSSCHRIQYEVYRMENPEMFLVENTEVDASELRHPKMYVYWFDDQDSTSAYNVYLDDKLLCQVSKNANHIVDLTERGVHQIYATTDILAKAPVRIENGSTYYLRCGIFKDGKKSKAKLELVHPDTGKIEFESVEQ